MTFWFFGEGGRGVVGGEVGCMREESGVRCVCSECSGCSRYFGGELEFCREWHMGGTGTVAYRYLCGACFHPLASTYTFSLS
jgi:hypothetical protein